MKKAKRTCLLNWSTFEITVQVLFTRKIVTYLEKKKQIKCWPTFMYLIHWFAQLHSMWLSLNFVRHAVLCRDPGFKYLIWFSSIIKSPILTVDVKACDEMLPILLLVRTRRSTVSKPWKASTSISRIWLFSRRTCKYSSLCYCLIQSKQQF